MYSIKAISLMTGVKPETLRTWERRFSLLDPHRDDNGRRIYSESDARKLSQIASLVRDGHPISALAQMSLDALGELSAQPSRTVRQSDEQKVYDELMGAVKSADYARFRQLISQVLVSQPPVVGVEYILAPLAREIGELWSQGKISVGEEHAYSNIIQEELQSTIRVLQIAARGKKLLFATPSGELHHLGLMMGCYLASSEGFSCHYLGANMPADDLVQTVTDVNATAVVLSVVKSDDLDQMAREVSDISKKLPKSIPLLVGSTHAFSKMLQELPPPSSVFSSFEQFRNHLSLL